MGNFCKDCKHAKRVWFALDYEYARCARTQTVSNLSGKSAMQQCYIARNYGACGKSGALFEPKRARTAALAATGLVLAVLAGTMLLLPGVAHAAPVIDRPVSSLASWFIAGAVIVGIGLLIARALAGTGKASRPEDYDSAGRL